MTRRILDFRFLDPSREFLLGMSYGFTAIINDSGEQEFFNYFQIGLIFFSIGIREYFDEEV